MIYGQKQFQKVLSGFNSAMESLDFCIGLSLDCSIGVFISFVRAP